MMTKSLGESIAGAMAEAAHGAALGKAIGDANEVANEALERAEVAEAEAEQLRAELIKRGIQIPPPVFTPSTRRGKILLSQEQFKGLLWVISGIFLAGGVLVVYLQIKEAARNKEQRARTVNIFNAYKSVGAGNWSGDTVCRGVPMEVDADVVPGLQFSDDGNLIPSQVDRIAYSIFLRPRPGNLITIKGGATPLSSDGKFSFSGFNLSGWNGVVRGQFNKAAAIHELSIPGCTPVKWNSTRKF